MKHFAKIAFVLLLVGSLYRPVVHYLCLPRAIGSAWVAPLATTGTRYYRQREIFTGGGDVRKLHDELEPVFQANEQKRQLYATLTAGKGKSGLFRRFYTVEARPIEEWLLVQDGTLTDVLDCSQDGGAPPWAVYQRIPLAFKLGFMRDDVFVEGEPSATNSPVVVFQLKVRNRLDSRQIDAVYFF